MKRQKLLFGALVGVVLLAAITALASAKSPKKTTVSGDVQIVGVWTGDEEKSFNAVLDGFKKANPDVKVTYKSTGDNTPTVLATAVAGGNPPDLASVSQPGLVTDFQKKGALKNLDFAKAALTKNYPADIAKIGVIGGHVYGLLIKGANKSTVWYNVSSFKNAGVKRVGTWPQFVKALATIKASGTAPLSVGGADGWTLTDLFENIYLRQAGPAKYDALSKHKIKWTDASVVKALTTMGSILKGSYVGGRHVGCVADRLPDVRVERVLDESEGGDDRRRRLRPGRRCVEEPAQACVRLQRLRVPLDREHAELRRRRRRHADGVQGHAGNSRSRAVPGHR